LIGHSTVKLTRWIAAFALFVGCGRIQQRLDSTQDSSRFSLAGQEQSFTFKNESIHYNQSVLQVGTPRQQVIAAFGNPNASQTTADGQIEDVYVAVRQARIKMSEDKLTLFHVVYSPDETIQNVGEERLSNAPENLPPPPSTQPAANVGAE